MYDPAASAWREWKLPGNAHTYSVWVDDAGQGVADRLDASTRSCASIRSPRSSRAFRRTASERQRSADARPRRRSLGRGVGQRSAGDGAGAMTRAPAAPPAQPRGAERETCSPDCASAAIRRISSDSTTKRPIWSRLSRTPASRVRRRWRRPGAISPAAGTTGAASARARRARRPRNSARSPASSDGRNAKTVSKRKLRELGLELPLDPVVEHTRLGVRAHRRDEQAARGAGRQRHPGDRHRIDEVDFAKGRLRIPARLIVVPRQQ